jgi:rubrerythrin
MTRQTVDACINCVMERYPGHSKAAQAKYFEAVHQELAPLARAIKAENRQLRAELASLKQEAGKYD